MLAALLALQSIVLLVAVIVLVRLRADLSDIRSLSRMTLWLVRDLIDDLGVAQNQKRAE